MSRTLVVRRLTAIIALLAILGFALPATAAPGARHASRATTVQAPGLLDQLLSWLGGILPHSTPASPGSTEKTISTGGSTSGSGTTGLLPLSSSDSDHGGMIDPNG
ncbi:MAG: hypothetical protein ACJ76N_19970 [Thermoanaerobaculia bacterium]